MAGCGRYGRSFHASRRVTAPLCLPAWRGRADAAWCTHGDPFSTHPLPPAHPHTQTPNAHVQVVDLEALRELAWSGVPPPLRPTCWRLLLGYLPPNRERRAQILGRKRREYRDMVPDYYDAAASGADRGEEELGALRQVRGRVCVWAGGGSGGGWMVWAGLGMGCQRPQLAVLCCSTLCCAGARWRWTCPAPRPASSSSTSRRYRSRWSASSTSGAYGEAAGGGACVVLSLAASLPPPSKSPARPPHPLPVPLPFLLPCPPRPAPPPIHRRMPCPAPPPTPTTAGTRRAGTCRALTTWSPLSWRSSCRSTWR